MRQMVSPKSLSLAMKEPSATFVHIGQHDLLIVWHTGGNSRGENQSTLLGILKYLISVYLKPRDVLWQSNCSISSAKFWKIKQLCLNYQEYNLEEISSFHSTKMTNTINFMDNMKTSWNLRGGKKQKKPSAVAFPSISKTSYSRMSLKAVWIISLYQTP